MVPSSRGTVHTRDVGTAFSPLKLIKKKYVCIPAITVLSSYAANLQMEYLISFLSLFSAPIFVLPFETCALIKQRSGLFSPLLKNIKAKHT